MLILSQSDQALVRQALTGRREAFEILVRRHAAAIHGVSYAWTRNYADAEDVTQEAFLKAFHELPSLRDPQRFGGWIAAIARNLCRQRLRKRESATAHPIGVPAGDARDDVAQREREAVVRSALDALGESTREILVLYYFTGRRTSEIAALLGITTDAAKKRLERARTALSKQLISELEGSIECQSGDDDRLRRLLLVLGAASPAWLASGSSISAAALTGTGIRVVTKAVAALAVMSGAATIGIIAILNNDDIDAPDRPPESRAAAAPQDEASDSLDTFRTHQNTTIVGRDVQPTPSVKDTRRPLNISPDAHADAVDDWLNTRLRMEFAEVLVEEMLSFVGEYMSANFVVLPPINEGAPPGQNAVSKRYVTDGRIGRIDLTNASLHDVLTQLLLPLGLDYAVEPGYFWISSPALIRAEIPRLPKRRYDEYPEQASLDTSISISVANERIENIFEYIGGILNVNFLVDYRVVAPAIGTPQPKAAARTRIGHEGMAGTSVLLEAIVDTSHGSVAYLSVDGASAQPFVMGDAIAGRTIASIDSASESLVFSPDTDTGSPIRLESPTFSSWPPPEPDYSAVKPGIVPFMEAKEIALGDLLPGLTRMIGYDYRVMPGYILVGPRDSIAAYPEHVSDRDAEFNEVTVRWLEELVAMDLKPQNEPLRLDLILESFTPGTSTNEINVRDESARLIARTMPAAMIHHPLPRAVCLGAILTPMGLEWEANEREIVIREAARDTME